MNRVWERVLLALVVCVPVPALALSGLNVPLPSVVERVAAALVPFAGVTTLDGETTLTASGKIVHTSARGTKSSSGPQGRTTAVARVQRTTTKPAARPRPSQARVAATPTPAVSTLAPGTNHGESLTPRVPEPSVPTPGPTAPDTKAGPDKRLDPSPPASDVRLDVDVVPEPDVKPEVDVSPTPVPDVKPVDLPNSDPGDAIRLLENVVRELGH
jgi:hypothetical protein